MGILSRARTPPPPAAPGYPCCVHCRFCTEDEPAHGEPCEDGCGQPDPVVFGAQPRVKNVPEVMG